jgi:hypothetical protein
LKERLIKLAKRLKEFTLCDMTILTDINESIIKSYLDDFVKDKTIRTKEGKAC